MPPYDNELSISLIERAAANSSATCPPSASWAFNSKGQSSCAIASTVLGACNNSPAPVYVSPLNGTDIYAPPNGVYANQCTWSVYRVTNDLESWNCTNRDRTSSWMAYNLLNACTLCQGVSEISTWDDYSKNCAPFEIDSFFPSTAILQKTTFIPVWATLSPTNWTERKFDVLQVQAIVAQAEPDIELTSDASPSIAISGGIIGGAVVLGAIVSGLAALFIFRWRRRKENATKAQARWKQFDSRLKAGQEKPSAPQIRQKFQVPALPTARINISSVDKQGPFIFKNSKHNFTLARSLGFEILAHETLQTIAYDSRQGGSSNSVPLNYDPPHIAAVSRDFSQTNHSSSQVTIRQESRLTAAAVSSGLIRDYNLSTSNLNLAHLNPAQSNLVAIRPNSRRIETVARLRSAPSRRASSNEVRRKLLPRLVIDN